MTRDSVVTLPTRLLVAIAGFVVVASAALPSYAAAAQQALPEVRERAQRAGIVRVIVELKLPMPHVPEGNLPAPAVLGQRREIASRAAQVLSALPPGSHRTVRRYQTVPYIAIEVTPAALDMLETLSDDVVRVSADTILKPLLADSVPLVGGDQAWAGGYDGSGTAIAVLDTGIDAAHPFLAGKVVEEACYSSTVAGTSETYCPNGSDEQIGPGAGAPCPLSDCFHGTHVAGIAAGFDAANSLQPPGVAKGALLMAVQVFSRIVDAESCGGTAPCTGAWASDIIAGLERVYFVAAGGQQNIAAVNMSLGGDLFAAPCDGEPYKPIIDNLRAIGVASVVASGNAGSTFGLSSPACISSTVSVGSTTKTDTVSWFSNVASFLSLFAPGESISSSVPSGSYETLSGTSMATPHVAGAWAIIKQAVPGASVTTALGALRQTGLPITDDRFWFFGPGPTVPRVRVFEALRTLIPITSPAPVLTALSPTSAPAGGGALKLAAIGSGFNSLSVVEWNGSPRTTTLINGTKLEASIPATDVATVGTAEARVRTPAPGGGESAALTFTINPPPALTVSASAVAPADQVTVTLANGLGGSTAWIALASTSAPNTSYLLYLYVGAGVTTRNWTVAMPATAGTYEFRLFLDYGYTRVATSPTVTVDPSLTPMPVATSLSPASALAGGAAFTLTVNGSKFVSSSVVRWNGSDRPTTFVSSTQLQAAISSADITEAGTKQVTVFTPPPGGGTSSALPFTVTSPPSLTVSATNVAAGSSVTVTLTNGLGGSTDWLALAATSAPNTSYLRYTPVGAGVTTRTWTVAMPATVGTYEFRLFLNNGYMRAATSPPVTVVAGPPVLTSLSPAAAALNGPAFTLTVNGSGFTSNSVARWNGADRTTTFISTTQVRAAIPASDLAMAGTMQVTVMAPAPGGGLSSALAFEVGAPPLLAVSAATVQGGNPVTVTLTGGYGGAGDWLAFALSSAANTSYLQYVYVGVGATTKTWTVTTPITAGTYEFRLFLNNSYTRAATSPPITVTQGTNPLPVLSSLTPTRAFAGVSTTITLTGSGLVPSSIVRWNGASLTTTFVSPTQLQATLSGAYVATVGTGQVSVFSPAPGGGVSASLPFDVVPPPMLTVNTTSVAAGAPVTVTLTGGAGGSTDWLAFTLASAPDTSYVRFTYVGGGVTARTWTITAPSTPGTYEFRLYLNNNYVRVATSPTVTVF